MSLPRVFFDTNDRDPKRGYWLGFEQSRKDLQAIGDKLCDGTVVTIYMPHELEMTATLRFDAAEQVWWADERPETIRCLDRS